MDNEKSTIKPADLRGILNYVPRFLGQTFVISLDGSIVENPNLPNILLDIAVLRSLQINVVIVHGIGTQLQSLSQSRSIPISNADGSGATDEPTLDLAIRASSRVSHQILEGLTQSGLKCAITNSIRAKPIGILKGVDYQRSGTVELIDASFLQHLIDKNIIPIIQPIGYDRNGHTLRINSDALAVDVAAALKATKILYLAETSGLLVDGALKRQLPVEELKSLLETDTSDSIERSLKQKATHALRGVMSDISRIHILDGRIHDGLISEVFSNEGIGTLIYGNEYARIRKARKDEVAQLYHLIRSSIDKEELASRDMESIENSIDSFYVYEIDGNLIGCVAIIEYPEKPDTIEISSLYVHPLYQRQGIGLKLVNFACHTGFESGAETVLALSTQSFEFFESVCGFEVSNMESLPESRKDSYEDNGRQSKILSKQLGSES